AELTVLAARQLGWRKSSHSGDNGGDCVELVELPSVVAVRDSKNPDGPVLAFTRGQLTGLINSIKNA
ncbi:MAG TPA: DUF397 domain-containing protein, partial [Thermomonospora sp.]|nr:DUF397 domain-containing protein [Thermomonospora sp.]